MEREKRIPTRVEKAISFGILVVLTAIALAVYMKQFRYDPATVVFRPEGMSPATPSDQNDFSLPDLSRFAPENLEPAGVMEIFNAENLADKINGKAELYFSAGFVGLKSQRFQIMNDPQSWLEVYVYDMGHPRQAFSVFSMQQRTGAQALSLTPFSYSTRNALFFSHGKYYVEVVAAVVSDVVAGAMEALGRRFVEMTEGDTGAIEEIAIFPQEGLVAGSITFVVSDAFGFQGMNHIFTAVYEVKGREVTAFLSRRKDVHEAQALLESYKRFLLRFGGEAKPGKSHVPGAITIDMLGDAELFFTFGDFLAGVRETDDWQTVEIVGKQLYEKLDGIHE